MDGAVADAAVADAVAGVVEAAGAAESGLVKDGMEGLPWTTREPLSSFEGGWEPWISRDATVVARALLGARLEATTGGARISAVIVETEAYLGAEDAASHAATRAPTDRNRIMYGRAGLAYVYRIYGMHRCLNVVTGAEGSAQAVLIRGLELLEGREVAADRRAGRAPLAAGPGRLTQALGVDLALNGHPLDRAPLRILPGWAVSDDRVARSGRIGVRVASEWPLRYFVRASRGVSRGPHHPGDPTAMFPAAPGRLRQISTSPDA